MADATCSVVENGTPCPRPAIARGWCNKHYVRWQRTGDPLIVRTQKAANAPCSVDGCEVTAIGKGMCRRHYGRMYRYGTLDLVRRQFTYTEDLNADFWRLVDTCGGDVEPCWLWRGTVTVHGYGSWMHSPAHRFAYRQHLGVIAPDLVIDHACHLPAECRGGPTCLHRRCVNPGHLNAVTGPVNVSAARSSRRRPAEDWCQAGDCGRPYIAAVDGVRLCTGHYQRMQRHGTVFADMPFGKGGRRLTER